MPVARSEQQMGREGLIPALRRSLQERPTAGRRETCWNARQALARLQACRRETVLVVSKGVERIAVPDVKGKTQADATQILTAAGFTVTPRLVNSDTISELAGTDDYEAWPGCRIQLFATKTEFQGKRVPCLRVCPPPKNDPPRKQPTAAGDDLDEAMPRTEEPPF